MTLPHPTGRPQPPPGETRPGAPRTPAARPAATPTAALLEAPADPAVGVATVLDRSPAVRAARLGELTVFDPAGFLADAGLPSEGRRARVVAVAAWLVPTLAMAVIGAYGMATPALWADELATWGLVGLPWSDLLALLPKTDAAIVPYYVLLKGWTALFGDSDTALRAPSVLAMATAAGLVGRLGTRVGTPRAGLVAGLLMAALPVTSRYAQEARPYALTTLCAVAATLCLVALLDDPRRRVRPGHLAGYGLLVAVLGLSHAVALALLLAHAFLVLALRPAAFGRWALAAGLGALPSAPFVWLAYGHRIKVSWIATASDRDPLVFVDHFFGAPLVAAALLCLALPALTARRPAVVFSAWALLPAAALLLAGQVAVSLWLPRYLLFTLPAWALLASLTIVRAPLPAAVVTLGVAAAFGLPGHAVIRTPDGHHLASRDAGRIITERAQPGDGILYASDNLGALWVPRDVVHRYVPADRRPRDLLLVRPQRTAGNEFAVECADVARCLGGAPRLWLVRVGTHPHPLDNLGDAYESPVRDAYVVDSLWQPTGLTVALLVHKR